MDSSKITRKWHSDCVHEAIPLKQGLKHKRWRDTGCRDIVHEAIPLKQGLKPDITNVLFFIDGVHEAIPLKQGLKQCRINFFPSNSFSSRGNSIKTRIETPVQKNTDWQFIMFTRQFH